MPQLRGNEPILGLNIRGRWFWGKDHIFENCKELFMSNFN
jgi:hypothetical protein